jgi:hypothetical protein
MVWIVPIYPLKFKHNSKKESNLLVKMKRKLVYDTENEVPRESENSSVPYVETYQIDYEPLHFLRCHSRKNDPADIQTQVNCIM